MRATILLTLGFLLLSRAGNADIALIYSDESAAVVYQQGREVLYKICKSAPGGNVDRDCPAANAPYRADYDFFANNVYLFYQVPPIYWGPSGLIKVTQRVETLTRDLADDSLSASEKDRAQALLAEMKSVQSRILKAKKEMLDALTPAKKASFDVRITKKFHKVVSSFHALYSPQIGVAWKLGGASVLQREIDSQCSSPWSFGGSPDAGILASRVGSPFTRSSLVWNGGRRSIEISPIRVEEDTNAHFAQNVEGIWRNGGYRGTPSAAVFCRWDFGND